MGQNLTKKEINKLKTCTPQTIKAIFNQSNIQKTDTKGNTLLHLICLTNPSQQIVEYFLLCGIDINTKNNKGYTPLHSLCCSKSPITIGVMRVFILKGAKVNACNCFGETPLHFACFNNSINIEIFKYLVESGSNKQVSRSKLPTPRVTHLSITLLNSKKKKKGLATILIENGGDPNLKNFRNNSKIDKTILKEIDNIVTFQEILPKEITILRRVGNGSFKEVYEGIWNNKCVAVAKLIEGKKFSENQLNDFTQEIITVCNLNHPNIIKFYGGYLKDVSNIMIICEFCRGGDLYEFLHSKQELTPKQKIQIALDIAYGIEYLHSKKLVHRDLKTPNVLFSEDGKIKIADFGLSKTMSLSNTLINHTIVGTPRWMAPELLRGEQNYTDKVDIYSFGIILWEISTGKIPFEGFGTFQLSGLVGYQGKRPQINESDLFYELIVKCWGQDQEDRPSIQRIVSELELLKSQRY